MQVIDYNMSAADANSGTTVRAWLNALFGAIATQNSGTSEPTTTYPFMWWYDTSNTTYYYLKQRNNDDSAWNTIIRYKVSDKTIDFMLSGSALTDLLNAKVAKVATTDNALMAADGTSGAIQPRNVFVDDDGNIGVGIAPSTNIRVKTNQPAGTYDLAKPSNREMYAGYTIRDTGMLSSSVCFENIDADSHWISGSAALIKQLYFRGIAKLNYYADGGLRICGDGGMLGYDVGGTATQPTSKFTALTLNKVAGQLTLSNSALAAGAEATFAFNNSFLSAKDNLDITIDGSSIGTTHAAYDIRKTVLNGVAYITLINRYTSTLSEAVRLNFQVYKGATA